MMAGIRTSSVVRQVWLVSLALPLLVACQTGTGGDTASPITGEAITSAPLDGAPAEGTVEGADAATATGEDAGAATEPAVPTQKSVKLVDRDVEAPEVFQVTDEALWDGRPSLGGVWVASAEARDPERVILRNPANGKFVIGALFRREVDNPGPALQISSDAAAALGLLAGQPGTIQVTALRREEVAVAPDATQPILDAAETIGTEAVTAVTEAPKAAAAADPALPTAPAAQPAAEPATQPAAQPTTQPATLGGKPIQIGFFSVEANAQRAVETLAKAGIAAEMRSEKSQGKAFWSVIARGDKAMLAKIKDAGFPDAYFLK